MRVFKRARGTRELGTGANRRAWARGFRPVVGARQRAWDTQPELALRRLLQARGLHYRVDVAPLPGLRRRADVVFTRERLAVFVDGCLWHRCPQHGSSPRSNVDWWRDKLDRNVQRDRSTDRALAEAAGRFCGNGSTSRPRPPPSRSNKPGSARGLTRTDPAGLRGHQQPSAASCRRRT